MEDSKSARLKKAFLACVLVTLLLCAILGILVLLSGGGSAFSFRVLMTTIALCVYSITGLCCSVIVERPGLQTFAKTGIGISIFGAVFATLTNWGFAEYLGFFLKLRGSLLVLGIAMGHTALLLAIRSRTEAVNQIRILTIGAIALLALFLLFGINVSPTLLVAWQLIGILAILIVLGSISTPVMNLMAKV